MKPVTVLCHIGVLLAMALGAWAQGFQVAPMRIELAPRIGEAFVERVSIANTLPQPTELQCSVTMVEQVDGGGHRPVAADVERATALRDRSCLGWITPDTTTLKLAAMETREVTLRIKVPLGVRGTYSACLLVATKPPDVREGSMRMVIQFLVPIVIQVQGPQARERLELTGAGMQFREAAGARPATTGAVMQIANTGESICNVQGQITVYHRSGKDWRPICTVATHDVDLLPGMRIAMGRDMKRRLPTGRYRVKAVLQSGGRQRAVWDEEIDFVGDPTIAAVAADVQLRVTPAMLTTKASRGDTRSLLTTVENPSTEVVTVTCTTATPEGLRGVGIGDLQGEDMSCADWAQVTPATFDLRPGQRQTVRVTLRVPPQAKALPNYYAEFRTSATYRDGQSAGEMANLIWVQAPRGKADLQAQPGIIGITQTDDSSFTVTTTLDNTGTVHFAPTAGVRISGATGTLVNTDMACGSLQLLPMCRAQFSQAIELGRFVPGVYLVTVELAFGDQKTKIEQRIQVTASGDQKVVTVVLPDVANAPEPTKPAA